MLDFTVSVHQPVSHLHYTDQSPPGFGVPSFGVPPKKINTSFGASGRGLFDLRPRRTLGEERLLALARRHQPVADPLVANGKVLLQVGIGGIGGDKSIKDLTCALGGSERARRIADG
jgi:hypothetical protein